MTPDALKSLFKPFQTAMADVEETAVRNAMADLFAPNAKLHMCHPFGDLSGPEALYDMAYAPLLNALPDLERRDLSERRALFTALDAAITPSFTNASWFASISLMS